MRYNFLVIIYVATSELGFECDENGRIETPTKIAEIKNFVVLTDEGYNEARFSATCTVCDYINQHYEGQEVRYTMMIAN